AGGGRERGPHRHTRGPRQRHDKYLIHGHKWSSPGASIGPQVVKTAAPWTRPPRRSASARLASDRRYVWTRVSMFTAAAMVRNSRASWRVRLATDRIVRSPQR